MNDFTHIDSDGNLRMVDVTDKLTTSRRAVAESAITLNKTTIQQIQDSKIPKGNVLTAAKIAGIQAAKLTSQIIPLCHPIPITFADIQFSIGEDNIRITSTIRANDSTGIEMEALTAASAAALTIYDMCKAVDRNMTIGPTMLISKTGGKSSDHLESFRPVTAILVLSDSVSKGISEDISGEILKKGFSNAGCSIKHFEIIPDNKKDIEFCIQSWIMEGVDLILTTGGTGLGSRDNTVQVVSPLLQKRLHGIEEALHRYGSTKNKRAMLSRLIAGSVSSSMIICLPGSPGAVRDAVNVLIPTIFHGFDMIKGKAHNKNH